MPVMQPITLTNLDAELAAMKSAYDAIRAIDRAGQERVLNWLTSRLGADWAFHADEEQPF